MGALVAVRGGHAAPNTLAPCTVTGTPGPDILVGTPGHDVLCGLGGDDTLDGQGGNDVLRGGPGSDLLNGGNGNDVVFAWDGYADRIDGGTGRDHAWIDKSLDRVKNVERFG
jgi:Ca2+-binding RTX toxin-like protein